VCIGKVIGPVRFPIQGRLRFEIKEYMADVTNRCCLHGHLDIGQINNMATATETIPSALGIEDGQFATQLQGFLAQARGIDSGGLKLGPANPGDRIPAILTKYSKALNKASKAAEAEALLHVREKVVDKKAFGGLGLDSSTAATPAQHAEAIFLVEAWLEAINSREKSFDFLSYRTSPVEGTRPMTLAQKIFAQHVVGEKPVHGLAAGDVVRVGVDWILASELSWAVCFLPLPVANATLANRHL